MTLEVRKNLAITSSFELLLDFNTLLDFKIRHILFPHPSSLSEKPFKIHILGSKCPKSAHFYVEMVLF
jgi:hypothetical protein